MSPIGQPAGGVFITHEREAPSYQERILALAAELTGLGIATLVDGFDTPAGEPRAAWTIERMRASDIVLAVCTERYLSNAASKDADPRSGDPAVWGFRYITDELAAAGGHDSRFVAIVFERADTAFIPAVLRGDTYFDVGTKDGFAGLLRRIASRVTPAGRAHAPQREAVGESRPLHAIWAVREFMELTSPIDAQLGFWATEVRERSVEREALPFFVGDRVRVPETAQRHAVRQRAGITISWNGAMNRYLGQTAEVTQLSTDGSAAVKLDVDDGQFWWASEWLDFIEPKRSQRQG